MITTVKRRVLKAVGIVMVPTAALVLLVASPASATRSCNGGTASNVCLTIEPGILSGRYRVILGVDFRISRQAAQDIINAAGGHPVKGQIFGSDPGTDPRLFDLQERYTSASDEAGLSAEFFINEVPASFLDEDWGTDEVYGKITITDRRGNPVLTTVLNSGTISQSF
ncbi:hypothetical protein HII36_34930 [Nonomuraea sp. NN258]|uniref:hypothetical protein n=1 Tax=Nonomuraea antri TaxID=2730852 RepID=UPI001569E638|nr:hypothetical protein [Nonomuraea antri]NRQ36996.1 hypothetical protein [Nonomuraea antri]